MSENESNTVGAPVNLIRLADGTLIDPLTREPISASLQPAKRNRADDVDVVADEIEEDDEYDDDDIDIVIVPTERRSIMDLSLSAEQMAVVNNVLVYSLWGLPDFEIAQQCNCTIHQVAIIRDLDEYKKIYSALVDGLRTAYSASIDGIFKEAAPIAAKGIVRKIKSKSPDIAMAAMKDILDRAGHRPSDKVIHEHTIGEGSELVIRVIKESDQHAIPTMELKANA